MIKKGCGYINQRRVSVERGGRDISREEEGYQGKKGGRSITRKGVLCQGKRERVRGRV